VGRPVLLVAHIAGVRASAVGALRVAGLVVLEASRADEARAIVAGGAAFDLLFTDVVLGGGSNGRQLADEIRQARPDLPVLYTTGYTRNAIVHAGRLDPGVDLLEKPFTQADLARRISALLDQGRGDAEAARAPGE
jgi:CheY-like chemotaxis protein